MIACISLNFLTDFYSIVVGFVIFLSANVGANIVMAVAVNLFPTNVRAMSTAFIMMCGRVGGVSGSSIIGLLLTNHCSIIFYLFGGVLISELGENHRSKSILIFRFFSFPSFRLCIGFYDG